jgi:hypothetical protein
VLGAPGGWGLASVLSKAPSMEGRGPRSEVRGPVGDIGIVVSDMQ